MAFVDADSFDSYATAAITQEWTQIAASPSIDPVISAGNGRGGTQSLRWSGGASLSVGKSVYKYYGSKVSGDTAIIGFWFKHGGAGFVGLSANGTSDDPNQRIIISGADAETPGLLYIMEGSTTHVWFRLNTTGAISVYRGSTLLGTTSWTLSQDVAVYLEFKVKIHNSTGTVEIRKDGIAGTALALTGQDTQNGGTATWNQLAIGHQAVDASGIIWDYDDLRVADGSGSEFNDLMGASRVDARYMTANGATRNWTPSTGTDDYPVVDESTANGDTDYLSSSVVNDIVTMGFQDLPVVGATIQGVKISAQMRKTDAGGAGHKPVFRIGGTNYLGTEVGVPSSFGRLSQCYALSPATAVAWTESEFNAAEAGAKKTA